jgi:hypothetical protein
MRRLVRWGLALTAVLALAVPASASAEQKVTVKPACAKTLDQPRQIVQKQSDSKYRVVLTNATNGLNGLSTALAATSVGFNYDESPEWTDPNDPDGRYYWYDASAWMLYQASVPCTGDDTYWAVMEVNCLRHGPGGNASTPCYFDDMHLALHRGDFSGTVWVNPWGYHKYVRSNDTGCDATNTGHSIPDNRYARSKIIVHMWFRDPFDTDQLLHATTTREMTSHWVTQGVASPNTGQELTGSSIPSYTAGPSIC